MTQSIPKQIQQQGKQAAKKAARQPWVEPMLRIGFLARGLLYLVVGVLAVRVALNGRGIWLGSGALTDQKGALAALAAQPLGRVLLILVAVGLVGYALWGLIRAVLDPLHKGRDLKGWINRAGSLLSAISYGALLVPTLGFLRGAGSAGGSQTQQGQQAAASVLTKPWGPWLVGAVGLAMLGAGVAQIATGLKAKFDLSLDSYQLSPTQRRWATRLGRFGYVARGIVFGLMGIFVVQAARLHDAEQVRGMDGALRELAAQPYGWALLGVIAAGLVAFGAYSMIGGLWFRFKKV